MNAHVPPLTLTHGQLAWVLALGQFLPPPRWRHLMAQLRYLRQLGIPFREARRGKGRGHRIRYSYEELMEVAVGLYALRQEVRPHVIAKILLTNRARLRRVYREALDERPATALEQPRLASRGTIVAIPDEARFLCVHNRYSDTPGQYELVLPAQATDLSESVEMPEEVVDGTTETLIPLTSLVWEMTYWAQRAPGITPGRRARTQEASTPLSTVRT
jgi:hypothetical protein